MIKKIIKLVYVLLLFTSVSYSQNKAGLYAKYTLYANTESPRVLTGILEGNNQNETYYATFFNSEKNKLITRNGNEIVVNKGSKPQIVYTNFSTSTVITAKMLRDNAYKIHEDAFNFSWEILNDSTKYINKHLCKKAIARFRGRAFTAWFTEDIAKPFGPYKFSGLPGLILEVYDSEKRFHWLISELKTPYNSNNIKTIFYDNDIAYDKISLRDFIQEKEQFDYKHVKSKLPRGIEVSTTYTNKRNGIELIYEWEVNNDD